MSAYRLLYNKRGVENYLKAKHGVLVAPPPQDPAVELPPCDTGPVYDLTAGVEGFAYGTESIAVAVRGRCVCHAFASLLDEKWAKEAHSRRVPPTGGAAAPARGHARRGLLRSRSHPAADGPVELELAGHRFCRDVNVYVYKISERLVSRMRPDQRGCVTLVLEAPSGRTIEDVPADATEAEPAAAAMGPPLTTLSRLTDGSSVRIYSIGHAPRQSELLEVCARAGGRWVRALPVYGEAAEDMSAPWLALCLDAVHDGKSIPSPEDVDDTIEEPMCVVCLSSRPAVIFLPCRHMVTCFECAAQLLSVPPPPRDIVYGQDGRVDPGGGQGHMFTACPVCRQEIQERWVVAKRARDEE